MPSWVITVGLFVLMLVANELGFRFGTRIHGKESEISRSVSGLLKGSIFGLVAFLLAFAFSNTSSRFDSRRRVVLDEANAIGTCYLRADLLRNDQSKKIKSILREFTVKRIELFEKRASEGRNAIQLELDRLMTELWTQVELAVRTDAQSAHHAMIVSAANSVIDMHGTRNWITKGHLQPEVLLVLIACVLISSLLIGHSSGQSAHRHTGLWVSFNLLFATVLFVILDFDQPRQGFIQVDHSAFVDLLRSMAS